MRILGVLILMIATGSIAACETLNTGIGEALNVGFAYDHRNKDGGALLFPTDSLSGGWPVNGDDPELSTILRARFPITSPEVQLKDFVSSMGGQCHDGSDGSIGCDIPLKGAFSYGCSLEISAKAERGRLTAIKGAQGCVGL